MVNNSLILCKQDEFVIKELDLSHNMFTDTGVEHLGQMLGIVILTWPSQYSIFMKYTM